VAGMRFTAQEFGLGFNSKTSLGDSFTCNKLKEVPEEGTERELSTIELERAFYNHEVNGEYDTQSRNGGRAFRHSLCVFFNVLKAVFQRDIMDNLQDKDKSRSKSIAKTEQIFASRAKATSSLP